MIYNSLYILKQSLIAMSLENDMHNISFGIYEYCNATAPGRYYQELYQLVEHWYTVYPKKYAHGFVVLCFVVVMQSFIMNSHEVFIHIHQGCFAGTGAIVRLPQCQWSKPDGYGKISQCITTTKHSKAKTVCIFLGIYCTVMNVIESVAATKIYVFKYSSAVYVILLHFTPVDVNFFRKSCNRYCKTVMKPSYLYNGNPFASKTTSLYWDCTLKWLNLLVVKIFQ